MSRTMNLPSGISLVDSDTFNYETLANGYILSNFSANPIATFEHQLSGVNMLSRNETNEIMYCEKSKYGYCISQEGLASSGYDLDNERSQGKHLNPSICVLDCKTKGYQVSNRSSRKPISNTNCYKI